MNQSMAALLLALLPLAAQAQIIKCTKPDGSIELSDRPCANGKNSRVYVRPTNEVSGEYHRRQAVQQRIQERAQYEAEVRAANGVAAQAQAEEDAKAERAYQRQLNEAYAKSQDDARRAARRQAAADADVARQRAAMQPTDTRPSSCDSGGCWGGDGNRYNRSGNDGTYFRQDGRACYNIGGRLQCN